MTIISHRGNINGSVGFRENHPTSVDVAIKTGYECEVDVWYVDGLFLLGHDRPNHRTEEKYLENPKLWCHAKNLAALEKMLYNKNIHSFWHEKDKFTITSKGFIWTFPNRETTSKSVIVCKDKGWKDKKFAPDQPWGICTNYVK